MLRYMLDTDISIYIIKNRPQGLRNTFNNRAGQLCVSAITAAELIHGAMKSSETDRNLRKVEDYLSRLDILEFGEVAAAHYGDIRAALERQGNIIGPNDLFIAAHSRCQALILVTNNVREFQRVEGLRIENWLME